MSISDAGKLLELSGPVRGKHGCSGPGDQRYQCRLAWIRGQCGLRSLSQLDDGTESLPSASVTAKAGVFAPVTVSIETKVNKILFYEIKDNIIAFAPNPYNAAADVAVYNICRRKAKEENTAMTLLASVDAATFSYTDAEIRGGQKYVYAVTTRFKDGREGNFSTVVTKK